jgi:hypothetical protein
MKLLPCVLLFGVAAVSSQGFVSPTMFAGAR